DPDELAGLIDGVDAVVNVTGVPVGPRPWTPGRRRAIQESRLGPTRTIVEAMRLLPSDRRPSVLVNVSGSDGYQGLDETPATEADDRAPGFLADLCREWEAAARAAEELGVRVAIVRNGFVIGSDAKALELLVLPFRLRVGGRLGSGRQWMSWVHVDDVVGIMTMAIDTPAASGPFNAVSPEPVHESDMAAAIGRALGRRSWLPVPALPIRLVLRDVSVLILGSVRAIPTRAPALGYRFRWTDLDAATRDVLTSAR
ncbi:MAG TPA: TIGR01777 family oxidoreductase, partial [Candidatus Limnocylindrales bacterium]